MEPRFDKHSQNGDPPDNSLNSSKTVTESLPNSVQETGVPFDFEENSAPASDYSSTIDNENSDTDCFFKEEDFGDETEFTHVSPIRRRSYSHWSEPWSTLVVQKPAESDLSVTTVEEDKCTGSDWTDMPPTDDFQIRPYFSPLLTDYKRHYYVGAGLKNLGNTCYLNSVLQCFTHTVPLLYRIISYNHKPCNDFSEGFCVLCALRQHVMESLVCSNEPVTPLKIFDNLSYFSSCFQKFGQEDAHEFLQCFLDKLEVCCNDLIRKDMSTAGTNIVEEVFGGRLVSSLQCCNCSHCSDTYEPLIDFSLEIDNADSLCNALASFTKVERIEDPETTFMCEKCKEKVFVQKQLLLDQAPSVAAFHLKRFKNDGSFVEKIDRFVTFDLKLDLQPYTVGGQHNKADLMYELYAVLVHSGFSSSSGHYYCFIRSTSGTWFKCDDAEVLHVSEEYVLSQEAYILFYAKQDTPCFSSFMEKTQKQYIHQAILNTSPKSVLDNVDPGISSSSVPLNGCPDADETSGGMEEAFLEASSEPRNNEAHNCEDKENKVPLAVPATADSTALETPCEAVDLSSESTLRERDSNGGFVEVNVVAEVSPKTPSRSPSPDIYKEDPPESAYSIPRDHLKSAERASCKRQLNKDLEDLEMKQACTLIKKSMPGSRGQQLIQAMRGSRRGPVNKKRSRGLSPTMEDGKSHRRSRGRIPLVTGRLG